VDSVHHLCTIEGAGPWWTGPWPAEGDSLELGLAAALGHDGSLVVHGESISDLTGARVVAWRPGDGGDEVAVEVLGAGGAWAQREEMNSRERCAGER
jgi:hypothetical protein